MKKPMIDKIILKNLAHEDAKTVSEHVRQVCNNTPRLNHPNNEYWLESEYSIKVVKARILSHYSIGAYMDGVLVGTGFASTNSGLLSGIYVSKQGYGVGALIVDNLLDYLKAEQVTHIEASVHPSGRAMRHLLAKNGFIVQGIDPKRIYFPDIAFEVVVLDI